MTADIDTLWRAHHSAVKTYLSYRLDADLVEDLCADVYLRALTHLARGGAYPDKPLSWLHRIAHNLVIDQYRHRSATPPTIYLDAIPFDDTDDGGTRARGELMATEHNEPYDLAARSILCQQVQHAIDRLAGEQPYVTRRRMEGYEYSEIAQELGTTTGAAKALNTRAFARLRTHLEGVTA